MSRKKETIIHKVGRISKTYRNLRRYQEIIRVLIKHGFGDIIGQTNLHKLLYLGRTIFKSEDVKIKKRYTRWERVRLALEELGPTFIKFGQVMSNRPDILPRELIFELEKLQANVPPFSSEQARQIIENEFEQSIDKVYKEFEVECIASASIAQVHKARLFSGEEVAVKIQRPKIQRIIEIDVEIMFHLASLIEENIPELDVLNPVRLVEEFSTTIHKEIDFNIEASHIERFDINFKEEAHIFVPKVYKDYTSQKVITLEYCKGISIGKIDELQDAGIDTKKIADIGTDLILKQIFEHRFFHADPHPGNVYILDQETICFLDFGMMGILLPRHRDFLSDLIVGFVNNDPEKVAKTLLDISESDKEIDYEDLEYRLAEIMDQLTYMPLKDIDIGSVITKIMDIVLLHRLSMPPSIYLLSKVIITIEGTGRKLNPDFDMVSQVKPYAKKLLRQRITPWHFIQENYFSAAEYFRLLKDFPFEAREIMQKVKKGKMSMSFVHKGFEPVLQKLEQASNRIAFAIVLASLIIGSSLIVHSNIPPLWHEVPVIGIVGFVAAGLMGFGLLISIMRGGKM